MLFNINVQFMIYSALLSIVSRYF